MSNFLLLLFVASVVGAVLFVVLVALKPITEKLFSATWHYYTNLIPVFFLLGGVWIVSLFFGFLSPLFSVSDANIATVSSEGYGGFSAEIERLPNDLTFGELPFSPQLENVTPQPIAARLSNLPIMQYVTEISIFLILVWAIGVIWFVVANVREYRSYRNALVQNSRDCSDLQSPIPVLISKKATVPMMIGFLKPLIILPDVEFSNNELAMILTHELVHYRRKDVWLKLVMLMATAVHWFNPAVRFLGRHINTLCELSCDEEVVMEMDIDKRKLYGETILFMLQSSIKQRNLICASGLCNSQKNIKRRLSRMLDAKKARKSMIALSLVATFLILGTSSVFAYGFMNTIPLDFEREHTDEEYEVMPEIRTRTPRVPQDIMPATMEAAPDGLMNMRNRSDVLLGENPLNLYGQEPLTLSELVAAYDRAMQSANYENVHLIVEFRALAYTIIVNSAMQDNSEYAAESQALLFGDVFLLHYGRYGMDEAFNMAMAAIQ